MPQAVWINWKEPTHGVNDLGADDVYNRPNRTIWANFTAEHNKQGTHISTLTGELCSYELDSYIGNGQSHRNVETAVNRQIQMVRVWSEQSAYSWMATDDMGAYASVSADGQAATDRIEGLGVGLFMIGNSNDVNQLDETYYYLVFYDPQ